MKHYVGAVGNNISSLSIDRCLSSGCMIRGQPARNENDSGVRDQLSRVFGSTDLISGRDVKRRSRYRGMCFACPSHGLVNIPSSKSFSSPFLPGLLAQMYDERRVHHVHNKLSLSLSPAPLRSSLSTLGLLFLLSRFEISPSH